jgi:hypothetical protein
MEPPIAASRAATGGGIAGLAAPLVVEIFAISKVFLKRDHD